MLKRKPEDNIKELTKIQKVKYMSAVTCILTVQEKNGSKILEAFLIGKPAQSNMFHAC